MMRAFLIIFLLIPFITFAQVNDTTEQMLKKYKSLYEQGLINETEYNQLKQTALSLKIESAKIEKQVKDYCRKANGKLIAGGITGSFSIMLGFLGRHNKLNKYPDMADYLRINGSLDANKYHQAMDNYHRSYKSLYAMSGITGTISAIFFITGIVDKDKCSNNKKVISQIGLNSIYISYNF